MVWALSNTAFITSFAFSSLLQAWWAFSENNLHHHHNNKAVEWFYFLPENEDIYAFSLKLPCFPFNNFIFFPEINALIAKFLNILQPCVSKVNIMPEITRSNNGKSITVNIHASSTYLNWSTSSAHVPKGKKVRGKLKNVFLWYFIFSIAYMKRTAI